MNLQGVVNWHCKGRTVLEAFKALAGGRSKPHPGYRMQPGGRREGGRQGGAPEPREVPKTARSGIAMRQVLLEALLAVRKWDERGQNWSASAPTGSLYSAGYCRHTGVYRATERGSEKYHS